MEATRGAALSSAPTGNPIVPDPLERAARAAVAARRAARHERAAALGRLGEAARHARAKANTRRIAGRGKPVKTTVKHFFRRRSAKSFFSLVFQVGLGRSSCVSLTGEILHGGGR